MVERARLNINFYIRSRLSPEKNRLWRSMAYGLLRSDPTLMAGTIWSATAHRMGRVRNYAARNFSGMSPGHEALSITGRTQGGRSRHGVTPGGRRRRRTWARPLEPGQVASGNLARSSRAKMAIRNAAPSRCRCTRCATRDGSVLAKAAMTTLSWRSSLPHLTPELGKVRSAEPNGRARALDAQRKASRYEDEDLCVEKIISAVADSWCMFEGGSQRISVGDKSAVPTREHWHRPPA